MPKADTKKIVKKPPEEVKKPEENGLPETLDTEIRDTPVVNFAEKESFSKTQSAEELITPSLTNDLVAHQKHFQGSRIAVVLLAGLLAGLFGGVAGSLYVAPWFASNFVGSGPASGAEIKRVVLDENSAIIQVVKEANPAVVSIIISKDLPKIEQYYYDPFGDFFNPFGQDPNSPSAGPGLRQIGAGSGFIVSEDGLIITNKHVVADDKAEYTVILSDGGKYQARVLALDPTNDLAVMKIDARDLPAVALGDSAKVELGQRVIAIGNTLGELSNTVTTGVISGLARTVSASDSSGAFEQLQEVFQTDAAINPGNSGGPLLNLAGQVIGVNTAIDQSGQLVGFAIPSAEAEKVLSDVQKYGRVLRPFVGVRYVLISPDFSQTNDLPVEKGALIQAGEGPDEPAIVPDSPADAAGLQAGDILLEVNGKVIDEQNPLSKLLKAYRPEDQVVFKILRQGSEKEILLTLGEAK